jgi:hypothetical protein
MQSEDWALQLLLIVDYNLTGLAKSIDNPAGRTGQSVCGRGHRP